MTDNMEETAVVREVRKNGVVIEITKGGGCEHCGMSGMCLGKDHVARHFVPTDRTFRVGDRVHFEVNPVTRIKASLLLFLFPLVLMVVFYVAARYLVGWSENIAILCSFAGLLASGFIIWHIDRLVGDKVVFEIVDGDECEGGTDENPPA